MAFRASLDGKMSVTTSQKTPLESGVRSALRGLVLEFGNTAEDFDELSQVLQETWEAIVTSKKSGTDIVGTRRDSNPAAPSGKKKVVGYVDGCFDITHSGHYNVLRQAREICDAVIVGLHTDEEIERHKGPPVMKNAERVAVVEGCKWVERVEFGVPYAPSIKLLDDLGCDFVIHGDDIPTTGSGENAYTEIIKQGRLRIVKRTEGISTTTLVGRMLMCSRDHHETDGKSASVATDVPSLPSDDSTSRATEDSTHAMIDSIINPAVPTHLNSFLPTSRRLFQFSKFSEEKPQLSSLPPERLLVIYIDGAFDLLHAGHVELFKKARAEFEEEARASNKELFLLIGVHSDATVNEMRGKNYPIMELHERVFNVLSCKYADEVVIGAPWVITPDLLANFHVSYVVTGAEHDKRDPEYEAGKDTTAPDPYKVCREKGILRRVATDEASSKLNTDVIVGRILENRARFEAKFVKKAKAEDEYRENSSEAVTEL